MYKVEGIMVQLAFCFVVVGGCFAQARKKGEGAQERTLAS